MKFTLHTYLRRQNQLRMWTVISVLLGIPALGQLNFASLGSWGHAGWTQQSVAKSLASAAKEYSVSFLLSPGSNFYGGIQGLNDTRWKSDFLDVYDYSNLQVPFYTINGKEDWGKNVTAEALRNKVTYGVFTPEEYNQNGIKLDEIKRSKAPRWTMPNWYYHYNLHFADQSTNPAFGANDVSVGFVFVDTNILREEFEAQDVTEKHWDYLRDYLVQAVKVNDWIIAVADTAIYSSGKIGNNHYYEKTLRPLLKEYGVDVYISGNDRDMEIIQDGGLTHINCGAGSGATGMGTKHDGQVAFVGKPGYCIHKLTKTQMETSFVDGLTGKVESTFQTKRGDKSASFFSRFSSKGRFPAVEYLALPWGIGGSVGPNGEGAGVTEPQSLFIRIVGSLGLLSASAVTFLAFLTMVARAQKYALSK